MKKEKYVAYCSSACEYETFNTFEEAKDWIMEGAIDYDGISEGVADGDDFIAKITHRTKFIETDSVKNYPCPHGLPYCSDDFFDDPRCKENCPDEDPWPYSSENESVGNVVVSEV